MSGIGGVVGCLCVGGFLSGTDANGNADGNPYIPFLIMAPFAGALGVTGLYIDKKFEENQSEMMRMSFVSRTKFVLSEVKQGLATKELYSAALFAFIMGSVIPSFSGFIYYYQTEVTGFT
jgi:hypothetical protein